MAEYIDRAAAIKLIRDVYEHEFPTASGAFDGFVMKIVPNILKSISAADVVPPAQWIPADEELPPEGIDVLCWYEYFRYGSCNRMYQTFGIGYQFNGNWGGEVAQGRNAKVLTWMPLPEPPEMDGGEDNG